MLATLHCASYQAPRPLYILDLVRLIASLGDIEADVKAAEASPTLETSEGLRSVNGMVRERP